MHHFWPELLQVQQVPLAASTGKASVLVLKVLALLALALARVLVLNYLALALARVLVLKVLALLAQRLHLRVRDAHRQVLPAIRRWRELERKGKKRENSLLLHPAGVREVVGAPGRC